MKSQLNNILSLKMCYCAIITFSFNVIKQILLSVVCYDFIKVDKNLFLFTIKDEKYNDGNKININ